MYGFDLENYLLRTTPEERETFLARLEEVRDSLGSLQADDLFVKTIGSRSLPVFNESYYADVLHFDLALLLAYCGDQERAAEMMNRSNVFAATGGAMHFSDHNRKGLELFAHQKRARRRGCPALLIASLPKSGSATVSHHLSKILDAPALRLSIGQFPCYALVPRWVSEFSRGGAVTHDHFEASKHNLDVLSRAGVRHVVVQVRDPRSAAWSFVKSRDRQKLPLPAGKMPRDVLFDLTRQNAQWISGWIEAASSGEPAVTWVFHGELRNRLGDVLEKIIDQSGANRFTRRRLKAYKAGKTAPEPQNVGQGDDLAWRQCLTARDEDELWALIPPGVRELLQLAA